MIAYTEDTLEKIEKDHLYSEDYKDDEIRDEEYLGIVHKDRNKKMRKGQGRNLTPVKLKKMKLWMRGLYWLALATFASGLAYDTLN